MAMMMMTTMEEEIEEDVGNDVGEEVEGTSLSYYIYTHTIYTFETIILVFVYYFLDTYSSPGTHALHIVNGEEEKHANKIETRWSRRD